MICVPPPLDDVDSRDFKAAYQWDHQDDGVDMGW